MVAGGTKREREHDCNVKKIIRKGERKLHVKHTLPENRAFGRERERKRKRERGRKQCDLLPAGHGRSVA